MARSRFWGCESEREARARWMGNVLIGKPGGVSCDMGTLNCFDKRWRSVLIHLSLSSVCVRGVDKRP